MLRINHLALQNFMNIQKAEFDFGNINYLYGEPASGKSAVFEAISVCFSDEKRASTYGEYVRQGCDFAKINMRFSIYEKDAEINVTLNRVNGTPYECEFIYDGITYKNTKATEKLNEFNLSYYSKIMFQMQNAKDIVDQTSASRLEYIKNLFNFDYSKQKTILTQKIQDLKDKSLQLLTQKSSDITLKNELSHLEKEETPQYSENDIAEFNTLINKNIEKISRANSLLEEENAHLRRLHQYEIGMKHFEDVLHGLVQKKNSIENNKKLLDDTKKVIDALLAQEDLLKKEKQSLEEQSLLLKDEVSRLSVDITDIYEKKNVLIGKLSSLEDRHNSCKDGLCPICGQKTDKVIDDFNEEIKELKTNIEALNNKDNAISIKKEEVSDSLEKINTQLASVNNEMSKNLFKTMSAEKTLKNLQALVEEGLTVENMVTDAKANLDENKRNYDAESAVVIQKIDITDALAENDRLNSKIRSYELCTNKNKDIKRRNDLKMEKTLKLDEDLKRIDASMIELTNMEAVYSEAWEILNKLLPQYRTQTFCEMIKTDLNSFIHVIFPKYGVLVKTSKKGCDLLYTKDSAVKDEKKNKWLDTRMSSGFERAVLTTAFKTILANYYNINLFVGDEIDKASSDSDSIKLISELLSLGQFSQVFLISHKKALGNYLEENYEDINIYEAKDGRFAKKH